MFRFLSLALTALLYVGCTTDIVPATGEKRFLGYTWQQEAEIGKKSSKEIAALFGLYRDPQLERYVTEVGNRVLATSHLRRAGTEEQFRNTPVNFHHPRQSDHQRHGASGRIHLYHPRDACPFK